MKMQQFRFNMLYVCLVNFEIQNGNVTHYLTEPNSPAEAKVVRPLLTSRLPKPNSCDLFCDAKQESR